MSPHANPTPPTEYEAVIGIEVHAQLLTQSKLFCGCSTSFGALPNHHTCPVCLGLPGALPVINRKAIEFAIKAAICTQGDIMEISHFARKNYFYPDLPKNYQISQFEAPYSVGGYVEIPEYEYEERNNQRIRTARKGWRKIPLIRIHMEEDAGKNTHLPDGMSIVDCNRSGVPLIEIVSGPALYSAEEATEYLKALHRILVEVEVCDGNMEEGSFRCDANVSIRPKGSVKLGTRVEIKNVNSFRFVKQAIEYEISRQKAVLAAGETLKQQTRGYDSDKGITYKMRDKEESDDYRYFPEPDLPPLLIPLEQVAILRVNIPEGYRDKVERFETIYRLKPSDAETLCAEKERASYFEEAAKKHPAPERIANLLLNELLGKIGETPISKCGVKPLQLASLASLLEQGTISNNIAKEVLGKVLATGKNPEQIVAEENLAVVSDLAAIELEAKKILEANPTQIEQYRAGKKQLLGFFVGLLMKSMKGKASPQIANQVFIRLLDEK